MELSTKSLPARTKKYGSDVVACTAGKCLVIETSPLGLEVLNEECPANKAWEVRVSVEIIETDV